MIWIILHCIYMKQSIFTRRLTWLNVLPHLIIYDILPKRLYVWLPIVSPPMQQEDPGCAEFANVHYPFPRVRPRSAASIEGIVVFIRVASGIEVGRTVKFYISSQLQSRKFDDTSKHEWQNDREGGESDVIMKYYLLIQLSLERLFGYINLSFLSSANRSINWAARVLIGLTAHEAASSNQCPVTFRLLVLIANNETQSRKMIIGDWSLCKWSW